MEITSTPTPNRRLAAKWGRVPHPWRREAPIHAMLRRVPIGGERVTCMNPQTPTNSAKELEPSSGPVVDVVVDTGAGVNADADSSANSARQAVSALRIGLAMLVAVGADTVLAPIGEIIAIVADIAVAVVLALILGWSWPLAAALVLECIPGVGMFPSWVLAVTGIALVGHSRKPWQPAGK
jgi:hypothetical protein